MELHYYNLLLEAVKEYFKSFGVNYKPKDDKVNTPLFDYFSVEMKTIKPVKRMIVKSDKVKSIQLEEPYAKALKIIEAKIQNGDDLNFHLSKSVFKPHWHDWLLNEWMIHHIHISDWKESPNQKFFNSSKWLLFVAFNEDQAIFIDIQKHNEPNVFAKLAYLEILQNNWPEIMDRYHLKDWMDVSPKLTDEDRDILRRKGYTVGVVKVNGKVYRHPGVGSSSAGNSISSVMRADRAFEYLHEVGEIIANEKDLLIKAIREQTGVTLIDLDLKIVIVPERPHFRYFEKTVGRILNF